MSMECWSTDLRTHCRTLRRRGMAETSVHCIYLWQWQWVEWSFCEDHHHSFVWTYPMNLHVYSPPLHNQMNKSMVRWWSLLYTIYRVYIKEEIQSERERMKCLELKYFKYTAYTAYILTSRKMCKFHACECWYAHKFNLNI